MLRNKSLLLTLLLATGLASAAEEGTITIVLSEEPDIVDPCEASRSNVGRVIKQNVAESLTQIDPKDGSIKPRLATAWEQRDANTWRFSLRQGVKFHDGEDFNAEVAVYSIKRTLNTKMDCEIRIKFFGGMELTPTVVDQYTIDVVTDQPVPILPTMMGTMTMVSPKTPMDERTRDPIGTGPYRFAQWDVGTQLTLEQFDGYWGDKPAVKKAIYVWRTESAVRAAMVETDEADIAPNIAVQDATDPALDFSYFNSETSRLRIDTMIPPLNDKRVREALNFALDRDAIRGSIFSKDVVPATQLVVPSINGYNPELKVWSYDPEKAQQLLAAAKADGVPVDKEITLLSRINIYPNATEVMEAIMAMYQAVGFNVKLKSVEVAEWVDILTKPYAEDRAPVVQQSQHDNNNGDAVFTVFNKYHTDGGQSTMSDAGLDEVIVKAGQATGAERQKLFQQAFKIINDDVIADVPMYHMVGYTRVGPRINFQPDISTNSELHLERISFK